MNYFNDNLKRENIIAVFKAIVDDGCDTRGDISAATGLSVVTVGRAVDSFLDSGVCIQKVSQKKNVGRHAGRILPDETKNFVLLDISGDPYSVSYFDLSCNLLSTDNYEKICDFSFTENLCAFFHRVKANLINRPEKRYLAIGLIVPGAYDRMTDSVRESGNAILDSLKLRDYIRSKVGMPIDIIADKMTVSVKHCQTLCRADENILYVNADEKLSARLVIGGKLLKNSGRAKRKLGDGNELVCEIARLIADICLIASISKVFIEIKDSKSEPNVMKRDIHSKIEASLAEPDAIPGIFVNMDMSFSLVGGAELVRRCWIERLVK